MLAILFILKANPIIPGVVFLGETIGDVDLAGTLIADTGGVGERSKGDSLRSNKPLVTSDIDG